MADGLAETGAMKRVNARVGLESEAWRFEFWGDNLTNDTQRQRARSVIPGSTTMSTTNSRCSSTARPLRIRACGLTVSRRAIASDMRTLHRLCGLVLLWLVTASAVANAATLPPVATQSGDVQGLMQDGVAVFRGLPYAAAPEGDLRWRAPQPAPRHKTVFDATSFGPVCPQSRNAPRLTSPACRWARTVCDSTSTRRPPRSRVARACR